ncbi:hypothetical protein J4450_04800 [Candidatus Micrarchaeota archaeon]|nr:hypothetical protein [Candidatus Micrarchaeota archaeon]
MKMIIGLLVIGLIMFIAGCTGQQPQPPKEISYIKLDDKAISCIKGILPIETYPPQVDQIIYPKDLKIKDSKDCQDISKDYKKKVIIGKTLQLGGCVSFSDKVEIKKDNENKKVIVTFVINSAPPGTNCLLYIKFEDVWIAVDYLEGYTYETKVKTEIESLENTTKNETNQTGVYTTTQLKENSANLINQTVKVSGTVTRFSPECSCPQGAICSPCPPIGIEISDGQTKIAVIFFDSATHIDSYPFRKSLKEGDEITVEVKVQLQGRNSKYVHYVFVSGEKNEQQKEQENGVPLNVMQKYDQLANNTYGLPSGVGLILFNCTKGDQLIYHLHNKRSYPVEIDNVTYYTTSLVGYYYDEGGNLIDEYKTDALNGKEINVTKATLNISEYNCRSIKIWKKVY